MKRARKSEKASTGALKVAGLLSSLAVVSACASSGITVTPEEITTAAGWTRGGNAQDVEVDWLRSFGSETLNELVKSAIDSNRALRQERLRLETAEEAVSLVRSSRWPSLDFSLGASTREVPDAAGGTTRTDSYSASVDARFDLDIWRALSASQKAAELNVAAQAARVDASEQDLARLTAAQYFNAVEATQLLEVAKRRLANTEESHDIVESGYRQGLNDALDLYLARNQVERERANLAQQEQNLRVVVAALQLSVARYPDGNSVFAEPLPVINRPIATGLPSELLFRRPDLQEAWLNLLAADAELAAAHKNRFPRLSLSGNAGDSSDEVSELLSGGFSSWSIALGLAQPLFDAGRLASLEQQAFLRVKIAEQAWLDLVYRAFADVENAISEMASLETRYNAFVEAERNARAALDLALDQYQRGLVTYTTVLESQRQAFDAEATVVQLKNQRLQNRLSLFYALGGDFDAADST